MLLDFEVQRSTRSCAVSGRKLEPEEAFYSILKVEGAEILRLDYSTKAWPGPPDSALGWWKSKVPKQGAKKPKLAPNEVLLELFDELAGQPTKQDMRYVLALLLIRRRVFREEEPTTLGQDGNLSTIQVYCPRREESYEVPEVAPDVERIAQIQSQLSKLLYSEAA